MKSRATPHLLALSFFLASVAPIYPQAIKLLTTNSRPHICLDRQGVLQQDHPRIATKILQDARFRGDPQDYEVHLIYFFSDDPRNKDGEAWKNAHLYRQWQRPISGGRGEVSWLFSLKSLRPVTVYFRALVVRTSTGKKVAGTDPNNVFRITYTRLERCPGQRPPPPPKVLRVNIEVSGGGSGSGQIVWTRRGDPTRFDRISPVGGPHVQGAARVQVNADGSTNPFTVKATWEGFVETGYAWEARLAVASQPGRKEAQFGERVGRSSSSLEFQVPGTPKGTFSGDRIGTDSAYVDVGWWPQGPSREPGNPGVGTTAPHGLSVSISLDYMK